MQKLSFFACSLWALAVALVATAPAQRSLYAQASVSSQSVRPFVTGWIVVRGRNGAVGGVHVDAKGVVSRTAVARRALDDARGELLRGEPTPKLRMVSLRGLEEAFAPTFLKGEAIPEDVLFLAGLQRIEYVLAVPEKRDIILAGPGEDWRIDEEGRAIGVTTGKPAIRLDDLIEALRSADAAREATGISCSIDPTPEGILRLQQLMRSERLTFNPRTTQRMRQAVGPQQVTIHGVMPDSHYARTMVAADYLMKRLAMGLEPAPVTDLPSYLELLKSTGGRPVESATPRWWLAVDYLPLLHSEDGLAWHLRGPGVKVLTEDSFFDAVGEAHATGRTSEAAELWAETMTARYDDLSTALPVFGQLRGCMDLSVAAAVIKHYDLMSKAQVDLPLLTGQQARGPQYQIPTMVPSQISVIQARQQWIVGISGGVDINSWSVLDRSEIGMIPKLPQPSEPDTWWW